MRLLPPDSPHGATPYVWLFYSAAFVAFPWLYGPGSLGWMPHVVGFAVFLTLYFRGYWEEGSRRLAVVVALAALGVALAPINPGALMFFVYATAFVGDVRTGRSAGAWIGGVSLVAVLTAWWTAWFAPFMVVGLAVFAPMIGVVNVQYALTRRRDASLRAAEAEVSRLAAEAERHRIAADVHDVLGHSLSVIVLKAELASKLLTRNPDAAAAEVADIERTSREALAEIRRTVTGFRSVSLRDEWGRARQVLETARLAVSQSPVHVAPDLTAALTPASEHALAMALREAVTNVIRHAAAVTCGLSLTRADGWLQLDVVDDGRGGGTTEGNGLAGMRARLLEVGGDLNRMTQHGTHLTARVPLS